MNPFILQFILPCLIALGAAFTPVVRRLLQYVGTLFHEFGHAIISLLTGGGAHSIKINPDTSGVTGTSHQLSAGGFISKILTTLAGYATPVNLGLALLFTGAVGWSQYGFWFIAAVSVIVLLLTRNLFGFVVTICFAGLIALLFFTPAISREQVVVFFGALLLVLGVKDIKQIVPYAWKRQKVEENQSDFHILANTVGLSPRFWVVLFFIIEAVLLSVTVWSIITLR